MHRSCAEYVTISSSIMKALKVRPMYYTKHYINIHIDTSRRRHVRVSILIIYIHTQVVRMEHCRRLRVCSVAQSVSCQAEWASMDKADIVVTIKREVHPLFCFTKQVKFRTRELPETVRSSSSLRPPIVHGFIIGLAAVNGQN